MSRTWCASPLKTWHPHGKNIHQCKSRENSRPARKKSPSVTWAAPLSCALIRPVLLHSSVHPSLPVPTAFASPSRIKLPVYILSAFFASASCHAHLMFSLGTFNTSFASRTRSRRAARSRRVKGQDAVFVLFELFGGGFLSPEQRKQTGLWQKGSTSYNRRSCTKVKGPSWIWAAKTKTLSKVYFHLDLVFSSFTFNFTWFTWNSFSLFWLKFHSTTTSYRSLRGSNRKVRDSLEKNKQQKKKHDGYEE